MSKEKGKPTRSLSSGTQRIITQRIEHLIREVGYNRNQLAAKAGINNSIIYKFFTGERLWNLDQLEFIANALDVGLGDLVQEPLMVKVVGLVRDGHGPLQNEILRPVSGTVRPLQTQVSPEILTQLYCLEIQDKSLSPAIPQGTFLYVQRGISETIKIMDYVVYWSENSQTILGQIIPEPEAVILKSLTQGIPDRILPRRHLALCDKIIRFDFP